MKNFVLCCGSTADLSAGRLRERDIEYIPFHYFMDGVEHVDDLGQSMPYDEFYAAMTRGVVTKTSQINADEYETFFEPWLKEGRDILYVALSSGISGAYNSSLIAKKTLQAKYPERKIFMIDSLGASSGYGLLMEALADLRDEGKPIEEVAAWADEHKLNVHHWFFSTDLTFYVRGGRISKAAGWFGTIFNICPLLNMDDKGKLIPRKQVRTKNKVVREIVNAMEATADNGTAYDGRCYISHAACMADALAVKELAEERFPALKGKVRIFDIGTTIGSHTGPGTVALFFFGKKREE